MLSVGQVTRVVQWVAVESSVVVLADITVWTWVMAWLEFAAAILAVAADSGSVGTILFNFSCTGKMVSFGVQVLIIVGEIAVVVAIWVGIG